MKKFKLNNSEILNKKETKHKMNGIVYYDTIYDIELSKERKFELLSTKLDEVINLISNDIYHYITNNDNLIKKYLK